MATRLLPLLLLPLAAGFGQNPVPVQLTPSSISLTASANGDPAPAQLLNVVAVDGSLVDFAVILDSGTGGTPPPPGITVKPLRGRTPAEIRVSADPTGIAPGTYLGRITLTDPQGRSLVPGVPLTFTVTAAADQLTAAPDVVRVYASTAGPSSVDRFVVLHNTGSSSLGTPTVSTSGTQAPWLRATIDSCPKDCLVRISTAISGVLSAGSYQGTVHVTTAIGTKDIPVSLFLTSGGPFLSLFPSSVEFEARLGNGSGDVRTVSIYNVGEAPGFWFAEVVNGKSWLNISPANGAAAPNAPGTLLLTVNPGSMAPGIYNGLVRVSQLDNTTLNTPLLLPVILRVDPASAPVMPDLSVGGVFLTAKTGATAAPQQQVTLNVSSTNPVNYQVSTAINEATAGWLLVSPGQGTVSSALPTPINVSAAVTNLLPGVYTARANFALTAGVVRSLNATLVVTSSDRCTATRLVATETSVPDNFSVTAGAGVPFSVIVADDCGNTIANGAVSATFSSGDPGIAFLNVGGGVYVQTWSPRGASTSLPGGTVSATFRASAPGFSATSIDLVGTVLPGTGPVLANAGTLNNFGPAIVGGAVAPGTIVEIFGTNLAAVTPTTATLTNGHLPTTLAGVTVNIGGIDAPLFYTSGGQLNAQVPQELAPNKQYQVLITANGVTGIPDTINVVPVQPAIAAYPDGRAIAQDIFFNLIDATHPAHPGDYVIIYLTGLGATNPPLPSGVIAPSLPLATVSAPTVVTIDGKPAPTVFIGLTPGFVGLYQIDVQIPATQTPGNLNVVVAENGVSSNVTTLPVK